MGKKKILIISVTLVLIIGILVWVGNYSQNAYDCPPSVMVDGKTYYCFSEKAETAPGDAEIAGQIRSCVDISGMPTENDQSNFPACLDQPYAWVDGQLLLYYDGQWNLCQPADQ